MQQRLLALLSDADHAPTDVVPQWWSVRALAAEVFVVAEPTPSQLASTR